MSKMTVKVDDIWVPMEGLKGDTGPLPADESIPDTALVTDGAKTNTAYLMRNRLTKGAEGELISVDDAYVVPPVSLSVDGVSTQLSTTGKNLLSDVAAEWVLATFDGTSYRCTFIPVADGASYFYHREAGTTSLAAGWVNEMDGTGFVAIASMSGHNSGYTFTNSDNHSYLVFYYASSTTAAAAAKAMSDNKIQVEARTSYSGYEKYTGRAASPSPDWPQEIVSVDDPSVKITAKNLLGGDDFQRSLSEDSAITFDEDEHGRYARWSAGNSSINLVKGVHFKENTSYTFIFAVNCSREARPWNITGYYTDRVSIDLKPVEAFDGTTIQVFAITTRASKTVEGIYRVNNGGATYLYYDYCGVFEGAITVDDYVAYLGHTAQLLSDEPLRSLPDGTKDELHMTYIRPSTRSGWAFYRGEKVKRVDVFVCNGSEYWGFYRTTSFRRSLPNGRIMKNGLKELLCNRYAGDKTTSLGASGTSSTKPNTIFGRNDEKDVIIRTAIEYNTVADFKNALAENPITIQYALATPETIDLGIFELPTMQSGITNLWSDPSTNLSVTYERDRNIVVTNLKAAVADLATS